MRTLSEILRALSLSILFGGSAMVVFVAITLVKAQTAQGIPTAEAAAANAPAFVSYGKILLGAAVALLFAEVLAFTKEQKTKALFVRLGASAICIVTAFIFSLAIVPPMDKLLPSIKTDSAAHAQFQDLHESSRKVFGATIVFALISLLTPIFGAACANKSTSTES